MKPFKPLPSLKHLSRSRRGFTLIEIMVSSAVMGFALVVMMSLHSQAVRSNMHAKRMTDCTYLAQAQLEQLHALPWTSSSAPSQLLDAGVDTTAPWTYFEHPSGGAQPPARSRIDRFGTMRGRLARGDFGARAETGIEQPHVPQARQRRGIGIAARRLEQHRPVPIQPQPLKVGQDRSDMIGAAARAIDILDPQEEAPAARARQIVRQHRRIGVPQMQPPCRTRRKARNDVAHDHPNTALDHESRAVLKSLTTGCGVITASS